VAAVLGDSELDCPIESQLVVAPSTPPRVVTQVTSQASMVHPGRLVEVGFLPTVQPRTFALLFKDFSSWLLSLERSFCSHLYILGWESAGALKLYLEVAETPVVLVHRAIAHLGLAQVTYCSGVSPPVGTLILVSGPSAFLVAVSNRLDTAPALFLLSSHCPSKSPLLGPARRRLSHRAFGGPTHFVATFGCRGTRCVLIETALRQTVGHVFDFGVRPDPLSRSAQASKSLVLSIDGVLHPGDLL
jgi:hypothetical protein